MFKREGRVVTQKQILPPEGNYRKLRAKLSIIFPICVLLSAYLCRSLEAFAQARLYSVSDGPQFRDLFVLPGASVINFQQGRDWRAGMWILCPSV